jgi:hypothetical protein
VSDDVLLGRDPKVVDLLEALGVPVRDQRVRRVEIVADCKEALSITVYRFGTENGVVTATEIVDRYNLTAVEAD